MLSYPYRDGRSYIFRDCPLKKEISSLTVFAGIDGWITSTLGDTAAKVTGAKSLCGIGTATTLTVSGVAWREANREWWKLFERLAGSGDPLSRAEFRANHGLIGASETIRPSFLRSVQSVPGISRLSQARFLCTSSGVIGPGITDTTAGCPRGNCRAAAANGTS